MTNLILNPHKPHSTKSQLYFTGKKLVRPTNCKILNKQLTTMKAHNIFVEFETYKCIESKTYMVKKWEHSVGFCYKVKPNDSTFQKDQITMLNYE